MKSAISLSALKATRGKLSLSRLPKRKVSSLGNPPGESPNPPSSQLLLAPPKRVPSDHNDPFLTPGTLIFAMGLVYGWAIFCETLGEVYDYFHPYEAPVRSSDPDEDDGGYHPTHDQEIP